MIHSTTKIVGANKNSSKNGRKILHPYVGF